MGMISKFQQGGGFDSLFTTYKPILIETPRYSSRSSSREYSSRNHSRESDDTKGKLTEKDLFEMLKSLDGLPNEMLNLITNLSNTLRMTSLTGESDINNLATVYLSNLYKLKSAKFNKELFDKVYNNAVSKGTISDVAITTTGLIYAIDKDYNIKLFKPELWAKVKLTGKYQQLTNGNLLWFRYNSPKYIGRNDVFLTVSNGINLESVHSMIKDRFNTIEENKSSNTLFISKDVVKGASILGLMIANGPDGYYKVESSGADANSIMSALNYIYRTLPENAKTRLLLETENGSRKEVLGVILNMLLETPKLNISYIGTDKSIRKASKESGLFGDDVKMTTPLMFYLGYGDRQSFIINPGTTNAIKVNANTMGLTDNDDDNLGSNITLQEVSKGNYNEVLDLMNVSMNGKHIDNSYFGEVVISDGKISSIDFPCYIDDSGNIIPQLSKEIFDRKKAADKQIKDKGIDLNDKKSRATNYAIINKIYQDNQLPPAYDSSGELSSSSWARFGVMNAQTNNKVLQIEDTISSNNLLREVSDYTNYQKLIGKETWDERGILEWDYDALYSGTLWIPLRPNIVGIAKDIDSQQALNIDARTQASQLSESLELGRHLNK